MNENKKDTLLFLSLVVIVFLFCVMMLETYRAESFRSLSLTCIDSLKYCRDVLVNATEMCLK